MSDYYAELAQCAELARKDGWRHRLEQWLRFEVVRCGLDIEEGDSVVDLGCGTGRFLDYLGARRKGDYLGIDKLAHAVEVAQSTLGADYFYRGDIFEESIDERGPFDWAVAIGTLVDGSERLDARRRLDALGRLIDRLEELGCKGWALVVLNREVLDSNPLLRLEPCLKGASEKEIRSLAEHRGVEIVVEGQLFPTDLFVFSRHDEEAEGLSGRLHEESPHRAVVERLRAEEGEVDPADIVAFWIQAGRYEQARRAWEKLPDGHRRKALLGERIRSFDGHRTAPNE